MTNIKKKNREIIELARTLVECTEADCLKLLSEFDAEDFKPLGGFSNNAGVVGNQGAGADQCLVEDLLNSTDQLNIAGCIAAGIDPEGPSAPKNPIGAAALFHNVPSEGLGDIEPDTKRKLSSQIGIVATKGSSDATPNISIFDLATGQPGSEFEKTFLKLNGSNKIRIPFTHGNFCMGSTGALLHSGTRGCKLIISRPDPAIFPDAPDKNLYALTVIIRKPPTGDMKTSQWEFLAPGGEIMTFQADDFFCLPELGSNLDPYCRSLRFGTLVKHFDYKLPKGLATNILFDLNYRLQELIPGAAIPWGVYERRPKYKGHTLHDYGTGYRARIAAADDKLEPGFPAFGQITVGGSDIPIQVDAFRKSYNSDKKKWEKKKDNYAKGTIQVVYRGQEHAELQGFCKRKAVGLTYVEDSLHVSIDVSELSPSQVEELIMPSRDRLREGALKRELEQNVQEFLKNHKGIKSFVNRRREALITNKLDSRSAGLTAAISKVVATSKVLSAYLTKGFSIPNPFKPGGNSGKEKFVGRKFPTFHTPRRGHSKKGQRDLELGRACKITFDTDASNDYFGRSADPGITTVKITGYQSSDFSTSYTLFDGIHELQIKPPGTCSVGDELQITIEVTDKTRIEPFQHVIDCVLTPFKTHTPKNKTSTKRTLPDGKPGSSAKGTSRLGLPKLYPVASEDWAQHGFDGNSALSVKQHGDDFDFYYNQENKFLKTEQKLATGDVEILEKQFSAGLALIGLGVLSDQNIPETERLEIIETTSRSIAPMLLPMINNLGNIEI